MDVDRERKEITSFNATTETFILAIFHFSGGDYSSLAEVG